MKILWLSHLIPYPPKGGVLQRSHYLIRELAKYHQVDMLAFNQKKLVKPFFRSNEEGVHKAKTFFNSICVNLDVCDIPSQKSFYSTYKVALKSLLYEPYNINWLKSEDYAIKLKKWLDREDYDVVHFDTISLLPYLKLVLSGMATTLDHHNIESHMLKRRAKKERSFFRRLYFWQEGNRLARYEQKFCTRFDLNFTCSDVDTDRLHKISPQAKVMTIPNGVDLDYFKPLGKTVQRKSIIFVGRMNWYPNIEAVQFLAEKIWPYLKKKVPDLECEIIGANPPPQIRDYSFRWPDFHVHGYVDDVRPLIESASVYVCPIQDGGGTKIKILDAMALKKAIVAHPIACEGIQVKDGQDILLAENENAFINYIYHLINDEEKRASLGYNACQTIKDRYDYAIIGKKLSEAFSLCIS